MINKIKLMKRIALLLSLLTLGLFAHSQTHLKVYLIGGQSNATGVGLNTDLPVEYQGVQNKIKSYTSLHCDPSVADKWLHVSPGLGATINHHGFEISLATQLSSLFPEDSIAIIKCTLGGSVLETQWRSPTAGGPTDPDPTKHLFKRFMNTVNEALASLDPDYSYELAGMFWMQGESDGSHPKWADNYEYNLSTFISDIRQALNAPVMPFIIGKISESPLWPHADKIRQTQDKIAEDIPYVGIIDANNYPIGPDGAHYTSQGLITMGNDFSLSLKSIINDPMDYAWPFNSDPEGWILANSLSGNVKSGMFDINITGDLPYMLSPDNLNINASLYGQFNIDMLNNSSVSKFQLYWIRNDETEWNPENCMEFNVIPNNSKQTNFLAILQDNPHWNGTIKQLRLNMANDDNTGNIKINYLGLSPFHPFGIDNGIFNLRLDLSRGGAISFLSPCDSVRSIINIADEGRYIQQSYYAGSPLDRTDEGQSPSWSPWPWNPIQVGDSHRNRAQILDFKKTDNTLYVKCIPMLWDMDNMPAEAEIEQWTSLTGNVLRVRNKINCHRTNNIYAEDILVDQELPAVYPISALKNLYSYFGNAPFTGEAIDNPVTEHLEDGFWGIYSDNMVTENWMAFIDDNQWGIGVYNPTCSNFLAGMAGQAGGEAQDASTSYIAPIKKDILNKNTVYEYEYYLIIGTLTDIRSKIYKIHASAYSTELPSKPVITSGSMSFCSDQEGVLSYTVSEILNAGSYIWSYTFSNGRPYFSDLNSLDNNISFDIPSGSGYLTVFARNNIGDSEKTILNIEEISSPNTPTVTQDWNVLSSDAPEGNQWFNSSGIIPGATSQNYTVNSNNEYYTVVTIEGCSSAPSNTINFVSSTISKTGNADQLHVYPNPTQKQLNISTNGFGINKTIIYDLQGREIYIDNELFTQKKTMNIRSWEKGIYILKMEGDAKHFTQKIIIK